MPWYIHVDWEWGEWIERHELFGSMWCSTVGSLEFHFLRRKPPLMKRRSSCWCRSMASSTVLAPVKQSSTGEDVCDEFDIGYYQNNSVVTIRSTEDITELLASVRRAERSTLWCDGFKSCLKGSKHSRANEESDCDAEECSKQAKKMRRKEGRVFDCSVTIKKLLSLVYGPLEASPPYNGKGVKLPKLDVPTFDRNILHWR